ncbi:hypothetical protein BJD52_gp45 [Salmonella phage BP12B]|uniref:Uncharacterized protein n=1 Tax=Salmonella phage BP12B TaxID=1543201 RepID=A0A140XFV0_9CAUD|nr:hypothetical protein BJD52_gp45 [Salmonella phage BP12B]AIT13720.1 hypothetical protein BP12B_44 [Salmonella phage BP12B]
MDNCIAWCEKMVAKASAEGNYVDWQNYTNLLNEWKRRALR